MNDRNDGEIPAIPTKKIEPISELPGTKQLSKPFPREYQELVAETIAKYLLWIFGLSLGAIFIGGFALILVVFQRCRTPQEVETLVDKALVPFLRGAAIFASTVFGPLLAFILGFYYGKGGVPRSRT